MAGAPQSSTSQQQPVTIRRATAADAEVCGRICYEAFTTLAKHHNFPPDFPAPEVAIRALAMMFSNAKCFCLVAEQDGRLIGSNCLYEGGPIAGVGPVTVDPAVQNHSAGRQLMKAALDRGREQKFAGVRLVQAGYHNRSLSLYAKLGFVVREPLACMQGPVIGKTPPGYRVRAAQEEDLAACNDLCMRVHGHDRAGEVQEATQRGTAVVAEAGGRIRAYASSLSFFGHTVGETNEALQALIAAATELRGPGILVPSRNAGLFRWCLENNLRVVQTMTLMTMGLYNEPMGAYLPSILY
jgi:GNAT superfamily N-acetyltransferase